MKNMGKNENIITAARELFIQYSFDKVSMDEIAKKAGVTKKTIYYYFRDKQELFQYFTAKIHKNINDISCHFDLVFCPRIDFNSNDIQICIFVI